MEIVYAGGVGLGCLTSKPDERIAILTCNVFTLVEEQAIAKATCESGAVCAC